MRHMERIEKVNHPTHYKAEGKKECIEQMLDDYGSTVVISFCLTNAYKYLYRAGSKAGETEDTDIRKAAWYFDYATKLISDDLDENLAKLYEYVKEHLGKFVGITAESEG